MEQREEEPIQESQKEVEQPPKEELPKQNETLPDIKQTAPLEKLPPKKQYKFDEVYDWSLEKFNPQAALEHLRVEPLEINQQLPFHNDICLKVVSNEPKGTGLNKYIGYLVKGKDNKNGQFEIWRRYKDFYILRQKLASRWPGCFIPPIPNKTLVGNTEQELIRNRTRFLNNFLRKITTIPAIYYSQQFHTFITFPQAAVQNAVYGLKEHSYEQILAKYKDNFTQIIKISQEDQTEQEKQKAWGKIQQFQKYFKEWKSDLNDYKNHVRKLTQLKTRYFKAMGRVDQFLLPQYEETLLNWFNGVAFPESPPLVMRQPVPKAQVGAENSKPEGDSTTRELAEQKESQERQIQQPLEERSFGIINSSAYKQKFAEIADEIRQFNGPIWMLYDILKFQLKQIDSILQSIEQCKYIKKEQDFLTRNININKEQIESLNSKKTTLKTFLMSGNEDQKKSKLANQSKNFEDKLQKVEELYRIVKCLVQKSIKDFHQQRLTFYRKFLSKAMFDEIGIVRKLMEFHIYELQLLNQEKGASEKQAGSQSKQEEKEQVKPQDD